MLGHSTGGAISVIGTVKWSARRLGSSVLTNLNNHAAALPAMPAGTLRLAYGRSGVCATLKRQPLVRAFSVNDMYK